MAKTTDLRSIRAKRSMITQTFSKNLKKLLRESGIKQSELAKRSDISVSCLRSYLRDDSPAASLDNAVLLAEALGVSLAQLYREAEGDSVAEDTGTPVMGCAYRKGKKIVFVLDQPEWFEGRFDDTLVCQEVA